MPKIVAGSQDFISDLLILYVAVETIYFTVFSLLYSIFASYMQVSDGELPRIAGKIRGACGLIRWLVCISAIGLVYSLLLKLFVSQPDDIHIWIISIIFLISISAIPIVTMVIYGFMKKG